MIVYIHENYPHKILANCCEIVLDIVYFVEHKRRCFNVLTAIVLVNRWSHHFKMVEYIERSDPHNI